MKKDRMPKGKPDKKLSTRNYKVGYKVQVRLVDGKPYGSKDIKVKQAFTPEGKYIGTPKMANLLVNKKGITPELASKTDNVCSIGKSTDGKWYGWSHRAICGFKPGSVVRKGDCVAEERAFRPGFKAKTPADAKRMAKAFADSVG